MKVNTDGCLLGALASSTSPIPKNCLDIGTGTGVIALMLAQKFTDSKITAIELNTKAFQQAQQNIEASPYKQQIESIHCDLFQYKEVITFDLIVCNPPYFSKHLKGTDENKNMALHNDTLPQKTLIEKVTQLLSERGVFMVIYPPKEMLELEVCAEKNGLYLTKKFIIENKAGQHYRSISAFSKQASATIKNTIVIADENGERTPQFSEIMKPFYL